MSIIGTLIGVYLVVTCTISIVNVVVMLIAVVKSKGDCKKAGVFLIRNGKLAQGRILLVMGFGDSAFKLLSAIPIIGILVVSLWFMWCCIKGTVTLKIIILYVIWSTLLGVLISVVIKAGLKACQVNYKNI